MLIDRPHHKHIVVIGAGLGGLTAAAILANRGFKVTVCEKRNQIGGRNAQLTLGDFKFDTGPTFLMMKFLLDEVFEEAGSTSAENLDIVKLEPMYRLQFSDFSLDPTTDRAAMKQQLKKLFGADQNGLDKYHRVESERFDRMLPCLQKDYSAPSSLMSPDLIRAMPHLSLGKSLFGVLGDYFKDDRLKLAFTFQSKYLGMSPWDCPGAFAILSYVEHAFGVFHTIGGLSTISDSLASVARSRGATIRLESPVKQVIVKNRRAKGVMLETGEQIESDAVVINADFAHAMRHIFEPSQLRKYTAEKISRMKFSCSTFMLYLGLDKLYDLPHHTIVFADDYRKNVNAIFNGTKLGNDISFYIRNASITDSTLAPEGKSAVYVLVPVANLRSRTDWEEQRLPMRETVLEAISKRTTMTDIASHIEEERIITPLDWQNDYGVHIGATFNLAHSLNQMLYFRPRNRFEEFESCYIVGGGTHPGSGIPTILESGRIAANLICRDFDIPFVSKNVKV